VVILLEFLQHLHVYIAVNARVFGLSFGEKHMIVGLFLLKLYRNVTDIRTDRQMARQTLVGAVPNTALSRADARQKMEVH